MGSSTAGVHQMFEGNYEQQGGAQKPLRPQGSTDPSGPVNHPNGSLGHVGGRQAHGCCLLGAPGWT